MSNEPNGGFHWRTALITGAASGIGAACAHTLDAAGIGALILIDRDDAALSATSYRAETVRFAGDVADPALWQRIAAEAPPAHYGVIAAGVAHAAPITDMDLAPWRATLSTNLDGAFLALQCLLRMMSAEDGGAIVTLASATGFKAEVGTAAYGASKAGLIQLSRVAAKEGSASGVRVNCLAPGGVDTQMWDKSPGFDTLCSEHGSRAAAIAIMGAATPLGRFATAEEIAAQALFLLSDAAATITGAVLTSDGGYSL